MAEERKTEATRHLGIDLGHGPSPNTDDIPTFVQAKPADRVVARLVVVGGNSDGHALKVFTGTNPIGRDPSKNRIAVNIGDDAISRDAHAILIYDERSDEFTIYDGGKANPLVLNGVAIHGSQHVSTGDVITLGHTSLRLEKP